MSTSVVGIVIAIVVIAFAAFLFFRRRNADREQLPMSPETEKMMAAVRSRLSKSDQKQLARLAVPGADPGALMDFLLEKIPDVEQLLEDSDSPATAVSQTAKPPASRMRKHAPWPSAEEIARFAQRYRRGEGKIRTIGGVRYRALKDFQQVSVDGKERVHLTEHTWFTVQQFPGNDILSHLPEKPLDALQQELERLFRDDSVLNPTSRIVRQEQLYVAEARAATAMPILDMMVPGVMTRFAFYGPRDLHMGLFFSVMSEAALLEPLIDAIIDSFHFADAELGGPEMSDDQIRRKPRIDIGGGRQAIIVGMFPIADEQGRLLCKNCGTPFDKWTVEGAHQFFQVVITRSSSLSVNCRKCNVRSVFLKSDLPAAAPEPALV